MLINELGRCPTRSDNLDFANNEQTSLAVFTVLFCFRQANIIKLGLYNDWSVQAVNNISECEIPRNQSDLLPLKATQSINAE